MKTNPKRTRLTAFAGTFLALTALVIYSVAPFNSSAAAGRAAFSYDAAHGAAVRTLTFGLEGGELVLSDKGGGVLSTRPLAATGEVVVNGSGATTRWSWISPAGTPSRPNSADFLARFPITPAAEYVDALFASAGVTPTAAERTAAINAFGAGGTAGRVAALRSVTDSASVQQAEFNPSFVLAEYFGYLRRNLTDAPDFSDAGYQFWLGKLNEFNGDFVKAEMVKAFINSTEYRARFGQP